MNHERGVDAVLYAKPSGGASDLGWRQSRFTDKGRGLFEGLAGNQAFRGIF